MQAAININYAQPTAVIVNKANDIVRKEANQKIMLFVAILVCLVAAVNL